MLSATRTGLLIRSVYALCLFGATVNHVRAIHARGWLPAGLPAGTAVYWGSLTFLDPFAAILLFVRPRLGVALTAAIITTDVLHNVWFRAAHPVTGSLMHDFSGDPFIMSQMAFWFFVALTAPIVWKSSST